MTPGGGGDPNSWQSEGSPAIIRRWRRVMAVGCSHGDLASVKAKTDVLEFRRRFQPEIRFELGDLVDTAAFRQGASGTRDEGKSPRDDEARAHEWLEQYEPNRVTFGNHDWRLWDLQDHPKAIVAELARRMWGDLVGHVEKLGAKWAPYKPIKKGILYEGGVAWLHGWMYNQQAVRDHAEMVGYPVVMAHLHTPQEVPGRTVRDTSSFCVGALADEDQLTYGHGKRQSLTHGHGVVYGEICENGARLWLAKAPNGERIIFPPGL